MAPFLTLREKLVLRRRSGAYRPAQADPLAAHPNTLDELATYLKLSPDRVRQLQGLALVHLGLPAYVNLDTPAGQAKVAGALSDEVWARQEERDERADVRKARRKETLKAKKVANG